MVPSNPNALSSDLRILVTNDDGIHAPGLKILEKIARRLSKDVWVVAPSQEQSGAGHSLSLSRPLRIQRHSQRRYSVDGTPTDCVLMAVRKILPKKKPNLVLSGINYGGNLGEDVTYSGTVAAAMEGLLLGIPSIALSQMITRPHPPKWSTALHFAPSIIQQLLTTGWRKHILININFPDAIVSSVKGIRVASQGFRSVSGDKVTENHDPRGKPYYWIGPQLCHDCFTPNTDLDAIARNYIALTPLHIDLTHTESLPGLNKTFEAFKLPA